MLHVNKREYEKFEKENKIIFSIKSLLYERKLDKLSEGLSEADRKEENFRREVLALASQRVRLEQQHEELNGQLLLLENQLAQTRKAETETLDIVEVTAPFPPARSADRIREVRQKEDELQKNLSGLELEIGRIEEARVATEQQILDLQNKEQLVANKAQRTIRISDGLLVNA